MATQTPEAPIAAAPGPELKLGGGRSGGVSLDAGLISRIHAAAGSTPEEEPEPATPPTPAPAPATQAAPPAPPAPTAPVKKEVPVVKQDKEEKGIKQVREAYERASARVTELDASWKSTTTERDQARAKAQDAETKLAAAEARIQKELEPRVQRLNEVEKRLQEKEEVLRIHEFTRTDFWHDNYVKPIAEVTKESQRLISELTVSVDGKDTAVTQKHLDYVLSTGTLNETDRRAREFGFPEFAVQRLVDIRSRLGVLQERQSEALKNSQVESENWQKQQHAQQAENQRRLRTAIESRVATHLPTLAEGDTEATTAFEEGRQLADLIANGDPKMTMDDVAETVAKARGRIIGHSVQSLTIKRLTTEVGELKKQLAEYRSSEPPVEGRTESASAAGTEKESWKDRLRTKAIAISRTGR